MGEVPKVHAVRSRSSWNPTTYLRKYPSMMVQKDPGDEQETDAFIAIISLSISLCEFT